MPQIVSESDLAPLAGSPVSDADLAPMPAAAAPDPSGLEASGRGALQGATLGFSDEIAGAIESIFSSKTYEQARDESRKANDAARAAHPFLFGAGEIGGGVASSFVPGLGLAKGAGLAKTALTLGAQGAVAGLGASDAPLVGPNANVGGAVKDAAIGGALGAGIGAATHGLGRLVAGAPEQAAADRLTATVAGNGEKGAATMTARRALQRDPEAIDSALTTKFSSESAKKPISLGDIMTKPAKDVLPVIEERIGQVTERLDPLYKQLDKVEGGLSLHNFVNHVDDQIAELRKTPLNERMIAAYDDVKESALKSWAPDLAAKIKANEKVNATGLSDSPVFKDLEDVKIPYRDFRSMVTKLQSRGSAVINAENPSESAIMKSDLARGLRDFLNADLERVAENTPGMEKAAEEIQGINRQYSALASIQKAVESRAVKEAGPDSGKGLLKTALGHGGLIGAATMAMHGNIPGAIGAAVAPKLIEQAPHVRAAATKQLEQIAIKLAKLAQAAQAGDPHAATVLHALHTTPEIAARLAALHATANGAP